MTQAPDTRADETPATAAPEPVEGPPTRGTPPDPSTSSGIGDHAQGSDPVRTFHGRSGRLGPASAEAMTALLPRFGLTVTPATTPADLAGMLDPVGPTVLEIGSGMGEATAAMAATEPEVRLVAVEVHTAGVAALLRRVRDGRLDNVRVVHGDAVSVLHLLPPGCLAGIRLWFPDPWPKTRHHKRRFVRPDLIHVAAERLRPGGRFHTATDWPDYADQMLRVLTAEPLLRNEFDGFAPRPDWRPRTRFESKAQRHARPVRDLLFRRAPEGAAAAR